MAKKSFISDNPAMSFISQASIDAVDGGAGAPAQKAPANMHAAAPEGYRLNPEYLEKKTRRTHVLLPPSVYEAIKARAEADGESVNETICKALQAYIEKER